MKRLLVIGCLLYATAELLGWSVSLRPRDWSKYGSTSFSTSSDGGLRTTFPTFPNTVGYIWTTPPGPLTGTLVVDLRVETTGAPTFLWDTNGNTCPTPATVRPVVGRWSQGKGNVHGKESIGFADRWWAKNPYNYQLAAGVTSIAIPIDQTFWTGLYFTVPTDEEAFALDMGDPDLVGLSFGGGCFFGHGIGVQGGTAVVVITRIQVQ